MAADRGMRSDLRPGKLLSVVLGLAAIVSSVAFWWVSTTSGPARTATPATATLRGLEPLEAAAAPASTRIDSPATSASARVDIAVMTLGNELTATQIAEFEALNPDIRLVFIEHSASLLDILMATKDLPDVLRLGQLDHVPLVQRGLLLDITPYISASRVIALDDLHEQSIAEVAVGRRYYGLPQGMQTPDFASLYINQQTFRNSGVPLPSLTEPLTYEELGLIARTLSAKTGRPAFYSFFFERTLAAAMAQRGTRMFNADMSEMNLTGNAIAMDVVRYFYDLAVARAMYSTPATPGIAVLFENGELPISQSGYWMGAVVTPQTAAYGQVTMLPPPVWDRSLPRHGAYLGGTRLVVSAASRHPAQAYRFIEWYVAGKPAQERARRGWGFPLLRSMEPLLPQDTEFDRQRLRVALESLKWPVADVPAYPTLSTVPAFNQSWARNIELAINGKLEFAEFASNVQEDVNLAIRDEMTSRHADNRP